MQIGNWVRGRVTAIDSYFNAGASDVALTIDAWLDNAKGYTAVIVACPSTLTTQFAGLPGALALALPSVEEQWGVVINEALAFGLPVIVSRQVGSPDALVRDGVNGHVVASDSIEQLAAAMPDVASSEAAGVRWSRRRTSVPGWAIPSGWPTRSKC